MKIFSAPTFLCAFVIGIALAATPLHADPAPDAAAPAAAPATPPQAADPAAAKAAAKPQYYEPTYINLVKAMIRFHALDMSDDDTVDAYALMEGCDLYEKFYSDDFAWARIRRMYRQSFAQNAATLPQYFAFGVKVQLERYDFETQLFRLTDDSQLKNVHLLTLGSRPDSQCAPRSHLLGQMPLEIGIYITPITIEGLNISADQAANLVAYMKATNDTEREIYAIFHVHIEKAPPISSMHEGKFDRIMHYRFQGILESVSYYADVNQKYLLWTYRSKYQSREQQQQDMQQILNLKNQDLGTGPSEAPEQPPTPLLQQPSDDNPLEGH